MVPAPIMKGKMTQEKVDAILASITPGLKENLCADCDLIVEAAFEPLQCPVPWYQHQ